MNRIKLLAIEVFKCVHGINPDYLACKFNIVKTPYNFRDSSKLQQPKFDTVRFGYKSFSYYGSKLWNAIPAEIKNEKTLDGFKCKISNWCLRPEARNFVIS